VSARGDSPDGGFTLAETLVASGLLALMLAVFTAGMVQMLRSAGASEALTVAQGQLHTAFARLDHEVRYASAVSTPSAGPDRHGDWYVEYLSTEPGVATCVQLRLRAGGAALERRSWPAGQAPDAWHTLATGVTGVGPPFTTRPVVDGGPAHQRLHVTIAATSGGASGPTRESAVTFTALNSSAASAEPAECTRHRPAA
jgi:type II secretory pathway pseudopilin PulG